MRREAPPNPFTDAVQSCNVSLVEASEYLGRSINTLQSWAKGHRAAPADVIDRLRSLYRTTLLTDAETDDDGTPIPKGALAIRRFTRDPKLAMTFDMLRECMPVLPDPDATVNLGPEPDYEVDGREDDRDPADRPDDYAPSDELIPRPRGGRARGRPPHG